MSKKYISLERLAQNNEKFENVIDEKDASILASAQSYVDEKTSGFVKQIHTDSVENEPSGQKEGEIWTFDY